MKEDFNMVVAIIVIILVLIAIFAISIYNSLVKKGNACEEAFSTMDVYLKKRYDLIPNLVNTVKGYATHEKETLEKVVALRNNAASASDSQEILKNNDALTQGISKIFALAEAYPDLKANSNFAKLQEELSSVEKDISNARKYYNGCVKEFNNTLMVFPNNIFAGIFGFKKKPMYEVTDSAERENVKVEF